MEEAEIRACQAGPTVNAVEQGTGRAGGWTQRRRLLLVGMLLLLNFVNYVDRSQLSILAEPIKHDLHLSDSQVGLLQGLAFAFVFSLLALPLASISDRGRHRTVLVASVAMWSIMTTLGGFAQSFWQLAAMRVGVAIGEAGLHPTSHSLISGAFTARSRGKALGIFALGLPLGVAAGSYLGGRIADGAGWRAAFQVLGPIGTLLLPFIVLIVPANTLAGAAPRSQNLARAMGVLWRHRNFRILFCAYGCATVYGYGLGAFVAPFFMREHGLSAGTAGTIVGLSNGLVGGVGLFVGGFLFDQIHNRWPGRGLQPTAVALALSAVAGPAGFLVQSWTLSAVLIACSMFLYLFVIVPTVSMSQVIAPPSMRATASALITLSGSLLGATFGPLLTGLLSDGLSSSGRPHALAYALSAMALFQVLAMVLYLKAGGSITAVDMSGGERCRARRRRRR